MKIEINNRQKICRPAITNIRKLAGKLMKLAGKLDPAAAWGELSVVLTDNDCIRELKARLFNISEVTDVISLRYEEAPGDHGLLTGEIFVNVQRALEHSQKTRQGWNASKELSLYLAHGCDHLMNSTDYDQKGYRLMRKRELNWLKNPQIADLSTRLISSRPLKSRR